LLWEEYRAGADSAGSGGGSAYRYRAFCDKYRAWAKRLKRSMRQTHPAGQRLFVDYAPKFDTIGPEAPTFALRSSCLINDLHHSESLFG
jgi:transposase